MKLPVIVLLALLPRQDSVPTLIGRLADDSIESRDAASQRLRDLGEEAIPALQKAAQSGEPETAARARAILEAIEWDSALNPALLRRYSDLDAAFRSGRHLEVLELAYKKRGWNRGYLWGDFEAYAIRLLDHADARVRINAMDILMRPKFECNYPFAIRRRPIAKLVRLISAWDPIASGDPDRRRLASLTDLTQQLSSSLDLPLLRAARARHEDSARVLRLLRASKGAVDEEAILLEILDGDLVWLKGLALSIVTNLHYEAARSRVLDLLTDRTLGRAAMEALVAIADETCRSKVVAFFEGTSMPLRSRRHVELLIRAAPKEAVAILLEQFDRGGRDDAAWGLCALGESRIVDRILDRSIPAKEFQGLAIHAARASKGKEIRKLIDVLADADRTRASEAGCALFWVQDVDTQREMLRTLEEDSRTDLRKGLLGPVQVTRLFRERGPEVEAVLERIVRNPRDPLVAEVARLLRRDQVDALIPALEEAILTQGDPAFGLVELVSRKPSDRMVERMAAWIDDERFSYSALNYLELLATPKAKAQLERASSTARDEKTRKRATASLARLRGETPPPDEELEARRRCYEGAFPPGWRYAAAVESGDPATRDKIKASVAKEGPRYYLRALQTWAHPDMIPALMLLLKEWDGQLDVRVREEGSWSCGGYDGWELRGDDVLRALAATGERSLSSLFVERLTDPDEAVRLVAIRTAGKWRLTDAVSALKRLVRSAGKDERSAAIDALAEIRAPGTTDFLMEILRDNPHSAPLALARLRAAECAPALRALLEDSCNHAATCAALDLLANPKAYENLDEPLAGSTEVPLEGLPALIEKATRLPARLTPAARAALLEQDMPRFAARTLRDAFTSMALGEISSGGRFTHLFRDGSVEICLTEEATEHWRRPSK